MIWHIALGLWTMFMAGLLIFGGRFATQAAAVLFFMTMLALVLTPFMLIAEGLVVMLAAVGLTALLIIAHQWFTFWGRG